MAKKRHKSHPKHNIVKIQVEAKQPKRRRVIVSRRKPRVSVERVKIEMQPVLVDNFVSLQKVMLSLADKLEHVSSKMERLLELFEVSAKSLAKKDFKFSAESNPELVRKLNDISEQNKVIARGLTLMHEAHSESPALSYSGAPQPQPPIIEEEYKKSVSFKPLNPSE